LVFIQFCSQLMLYREIIAVCSEIHTKHINTLCEQNVEMLHVKLAVYIVTTFLQVIAPQFTKTKRQNQVETASVQMEQTAQSDAGALPDRSPSPTRRCAQQNRTLVFQPPLIYISVSCIVRILAHDRVTCLNASSNLDLYCLPRFRSSRIAAQLALLICCSLSEKKRTQISEKPRG
jgi:hypothetical protein